MQDIPSDIEVYPVHHLPIIKAYTDKLGFVSSINHRLLPISARDICVVIAIQSSRHQPDDWEAMMKTTTRTPAQAEHQLTHVADRFDQWRQTRPTPAEPMPQYVWEQAVALTTTCSIARVATRLQISGEELPQRCAAHHAALAPPASTAALAFVEVPATPARPLPTAAIELELHRPDGARLRIAAQEPQLPLRAMVRAFLETP